MRAEDFRLSRRFSLTLANETALVGPVRGALLRLIIFMNTISGDVATAIGLKVHAREGSGDIRARALVQGG